MLAGNKDNHKSLDAFELQPDSTTDCSVSVECQKKSTYNLISNLVSSFLIGYSSFLQETRTTIIECRPDRTSDS